MWDIEGNLELEPRRNRKRWTFLLLPGREGIGMSQGDTYRIVTPTVAIASLEEGRMIVTIPKSAVIEVVSSVMSIDRLVEIQWKDRRLVMFTQDLRERGRFLSNRNNLKRIAL
jgi:hypothetical protein